ncbi:MAG: ABC transporter ATP-binding protein [Spirochaetaceae bacterium]|nr:ABC transporter ATP-binding protein [Spirochaetaceae bacterium]
MNIISVENLHLSRGDVKIFSNFSLYIKENERVAILAHSGIGKTTLLDCIAGLVPKESGCVNSPKRLSYLFQEPRLLPWCSLEKNVLLPISEILSEKEAKSRAEFFLSQVGLLERKMSLPAKTSGGEKQRCAIARAFAFPSSVLLMDEAFQSQDFSLRLKLMQLMEKLLETEKRTLVLVTHDIREALCLADRIILLGKRPVEIELDIKNLRNQSIPERYISPNKEALEIEKEILDLLCRK